MKPAEVQSLKQSLCTFVRTELCDDLMEVDTASSFEELGIDSIFLMEIVLFIERSCECQVSAASLTAEALQSIDTLVDAIVHEQK